MTVIGMTPFAHAKVAVLQRTAAPHRGHEGADPSTGKMRHSSMASFDPSVARKVLNLHPLEDSIEVACCSSLQCWEVRVGHELLGPH